jgi:hypothetical protein
MLQDVAALPHVEHRASHTRSDFISNTTLAIRKNIINVVEEQISLELAAFDTPRNRRICKSPFDFRKISLSRVKVQKAELNS